MSTIRVTRCRQRGQPHACPNPSKRPSKYNVLTPATIDDEVQAPATLDVLDIFNSSDMLVERETRMTDEQDPTNHPIR